MTFVTEVYKVITGFPKEETYGIANQLRRAAVSVPSNIAEGAARFSNKEFGQFLHVASGSSSEMETQIMISKNLDYISEETEETLL